MDWNVIKGQWKQIKGTAREKWGKLTDQDFEVIAGHKDKLIGKLQERYGYTKEKAEQEADRFAKTCDSCCSSKTSSDAISKHL